MGYLKSIAKSTCWQSYVSNNWLLTGSSLGSYTCSELWYAMRFVMWSFQLVVHNKAWTSWLDCGHNLNVLCQQIAWLLQLVVATLALKMTHKRSHGTIAVWIYFKAFFFLVFHRVVKCLFPKVLHHYTNAYSFKFGTTLVTNIILP